MSKAGDTPALRKRYGKCAKGGYGILGVPDFFADGKEIGEGGKARNSLGGQSAFGHHRHLHDVCPPCKQVIARGLCVPKRGNGAKGHVICARFARHQPVMARPGAIAAHNGVRPECLARIADRLFGAGQMHTVKAQPFGKACVIGNHKGNVMRMRDSAAGVGGAG